MARLIDADALKEKFIDSDEALRWEYIWIVRMKIDDAPTIDRWIPVTERLPDEDGYVIISTEDGKVWIAWYVVEWGHFPVVDKITAWMPLPKPYERSKEDGHE